MARASVTFSYDTEKDIDIANWLANLDTGKASEAIRAAIRAGLALTAGVNLASIYRIAQDTHRLLETLERKIEAGAVVVKDETIDDLPAEQKNLLGNLGKIG